MEYKPYKKGKVMVQNHRFKFLLLATVLVLIIPAFSGSGLLGTVLFISSMSFLFVQSMIVATTKRSKSLIFRIIIVVVMIIFFSMDPYGERSEILELIRLLLLAIFFVFVTFYLIRYLTKASEVNVNVIITSINIYLLFGIISASLASLCFLIYPGAYQFPDSISHPSFVTFLYYSFITMSTVGYGDITPRLQETQTLAYFTAITGQLYVAIIIAFLVGKLLMHPEEGKE